MRLMGRYEVIRELGRGGMGRVYQAVDTVTGQQVAAKVMNATGEVDLQALLRFQQEGTVLATLRHPNIVRVYGTFLEEQSCSIIMELLNGRSLAEILRSERLSLERIKYLSEQVASALAYAHLHGIIHRDIKPDNIMVVEEHPEGSRVKVTDFGIARIIGGGGPHTQTGMSLGTPLYMAPEQIRGQAVDGRVDIYSLGAVIYQMVTGRPPFEGADALSIAFKHVNELPEPPTRVVGGVPPDWEELILRALAKNPVDRFQTAQDMQEAISRLSGGYPSGWVAPTPAVVPWSGGGYDSSARGAYSTGRTADMPLARDQGYNEPPPVVAAGTAVKPPSRQGVNPLLWIAALAVVALLGGGAVAFALSQSSHHSSGSPTVPVVAPTNTAGPTSVPATATLAPTSAAATATSAPITSTPAPPTATAAPPTPAPTVDPLTHDQTVIKQHGYTPESSQGAQAALSSGDTMYAWPAICAGSGDGYCQKVFFFIDTRYLGTDTSADSLAIIKVANAGPSAIAVTYANYGPNDANCCPSKKPVTITYTWTGSKLSPDGVPPGH